MSPSVEAQLRARLDLSHPLPLVGLTSYQGASSLALVVDWFGLTPMDADLRQAKRGKPVPSSPSEADAPLPDQKQSLRMKAVRAGTRWSDSPAAKRSRQGRERAKARMQMLGLA